MSQVDETIRNPIRNAMTIDVEDYFQVSAFEEHIPRSHWTRLPCRVQRNTERTLDLLDRHGIRSTFFVLGWVAERYPVLVRAIVENGHELASHGYQHVRVTQQNRDEFRQDVIHTKHLLEDVSGTKVLGYRAASYSIVESTLWAHDELQTSGYCYSSSIYPIRHDLYGIHSAPRFPFYPLENNGLMEIPITTVSIMKQRLPCGGGGYFRLYPYPLFRAALRWVNHREGRPGVFYFHPWEIDPDQPRQNGVGFKTRFRHYLNLHRTEARLERLCKDFQWGRMDEVFLCREDAGRD